MSYKQTFALLCIVFLTAPSFAQEGEVDPAIACFNSLAEKPSLSVLREKIALVDSRAQTLAMLSNDSKPKKTEREAISIWVVEVEKCIASSRPWHREHYPASMLSSIDKYFATMKLNAADLYAGKLSFGAFARDRAALTSKLDSELVEMGQAIREQQRQANAAVEFKSTQDKRQAALDAERKEEAEWTRRQQEQQFEQTMADAERTRRMNFIQNMNRNNAQSGYQVVQPPVMGRGSSCTSTVSGNVVSTNCRPNGLQVPW